MQMSASKREVLPSSGDSAAHARPRNNVTRADRTQARPIPR